MKIISKTSGLILAMVFLMLGTSVFAQGRFRFRNDSLAFPDRGFYSSTVMSLTEEQQNQINEIRIAHIKEVTDIRNDLAIKRAELRKLQSVDPVNMNQVNQKIDEIGNLTTELAKKNAAYQESVKEVLTEEQKSYFNSRGGMMGPNFENRGFDNSAINMHKNNNRPMRGRR